MPLLPMRATRSPRLMSMSTFSKRSWGPKAFFRPRTVSTSLPLRMFGSRRMCISSLISAGFSSRSIFSSIFSRLSARLMDFSRLKDFNLAMTSSWWRISCCWFSQAFILASRSMARFWL